MNHQPSRRNFLKTASVAAFCAAGGGISQVPAIAQKPIERVGGPSLKVSLNAYSFGKLLNDQIKHRAPGISLIDLLEFCATQNVDGLDPNGYFFHSYPEVPKDDYVNNFKQRASELGIGSSGLGV